MSIIADRKAFAAELAWRKEQVAEYDIDCQLQKMAIWRETIFTKSKRRSEIVRKELPALQDDIDFAEAQCVLDINDMTGDNGKPTYSNAETRKAALTIKLGTDDRYLGLLDQRTSLQLILDLLDAELDIASKRYAACRQEIELNIAMLRVMGL